MKIYVSPSTQEWNKGKGKYNNEEQRMHELADLVVPLLEFNGFDVVRNKNSKNMTLNQIVEDSKNKVNGDGIHLSLHSNAGGGTGTEIYYYTGSKDGKKLAEAIYKHVAPLTPNEDRGVKRNKTFLELKGTRAIAVLLEVLFHDNLEEATWLIENMEHVAEEIVKGVCEYAGKTFKKDSDKTVDFYRVITGSFENKQNAISRKKQLERAGYDSFIEPYKK